MDILISYGLFLYNKDKPSPINYYYHRYKPSPSNYYYHRYKWSPSNYYYHRYKWSPMDYFTLINLNEILWKYLDIIDIIWNI